MKRIERDKARELRKEGYSVMEITNALSVAKSSVSLWVRSISLTSKQKRRLSEKGHSLEITAKRRATRLSNEYARRQVFFRTGVAEIKTISQRDIFFMGQGLYLGEGAKYSRGNASFYNSDPRIIQIMMRFYKEICKVPDAKFRAQVLLHPHLNSQRAEKYWSKISGIPRSQFQKTSQQHNKASKGKKDSLPMGTFTIGVYDTQLFLKIMGWMEGTYQRMIPPSIQIPSRYQRVL
jgi:predicted transcriptional regulator